jgi:ubiquinol-cytochrome c reductase cytochrome b subunit
MFGAIIMLFILPWLDRSDVKSIKYKGMISKAALAIFVVAFIALSWLGTQPATPVATMFARIFAVIYFAFFLLMPFYSKMDKTKPVPDRLPEPGQ